MNRVLTIAREDVRRALRDKLVWVAIVLLGLMFLPSTATIATTRGRPIKELLLLLPYDLITFALVVVAAVGYTSVVGEREAGTVKFVLGLPATRRDLILGKLLSRTAIVVFALTVTLGIANVLVARGYGELYLVSFWSMGAWMLLYGVVWTAVTVGYSAAFSSQYRTLGALVVTYVAFSPAAGVWGVVFRPLFALLFTGSLSVPSFDNLSAAPLWLRVTERLNPIIDFWEALRWSVELVGPGTPTGGPVPHLLGTVVFLSFGVIPLVFGCLHFERTDIDVEGPKLQAGKYLRWLLNGAVVPLTNNRPGRNSPSVPTRMLTIAREDVRHALQNWVVVGGVTVTLLLVGPSLWQGLNPNSISTTTEEIASIPRTFSLPVLVLGIAVGYRAVVGEREAKTVRLVLGLPVTRRDLVLGKLIARVTISVVALVPLLLFAEMLLVMRFGGLYLAEFVAWAGWVLVYVIIWTCVVIGTSAMVSSRYRTLSVILGIYLLFSSSVGVWNPVVRPLFAFVFTGDFSVQDFVRASDGGPLWFRYTDHLNPLTALRTVKDGLLTISGVGTGTASMDVSLFIYSVVVCLLFGAVPIYLGCQRFVRSDLE